jgi:hypothetical protein
MNLMEKKKPPKGRLILIGAIAAILLTGWWPWNVLLTICACACWRLYRLHQVGRAKFDAVRASRIREVSAGNFEPDPGCWSLRSRKGVIDARPARDGGSGSGTREEPGNPVYARNTAYGGQGFNPGTMRDAGSNGAASRVKCIMSGRPGCVCEFPTVNEFLAHFSDVIEERQNVARTHRAEQ